MRWWSGTNLDVSSFRDYFCLDSFLSRRSFSFRDSLVRSNLKLTNLFLSIFLVVALLITPEMQQDIYPYTGLHASERLAIDQGTLETMYLSDADIPDSPAEPDPSRIVEDGPETRYYEAVVEAAPPPQQFYPPLPPPPGPASLAGGPLSGIGGIGGLDLSLILSQLNAAGAASAPAPAPSNVYHPPPSSSSSYYPGIPPPSQQQSNEYNPNYPPSSTSYGHNQYGQPQPQGGPSSYNREGGALPPQQQMHESSFGGKRKGGGGGENNGGQRGGKKGQQHAGGGGGERPWGGNNDGGGGGGFGGRENRDQQLERERNKKGPCKFFASGR